MDLAAFRSTLGREQPPSGLTPHLCALWYVGSRDWNRAHAQIQASNDADACWIHAHLHRLEGDLPNAAYWYARAGREPPTGDIQSEWEQIAAALLARNDE